MYYKYQCASNYTAVHMYNTCVVYYVYTLMYMHIHVHMCICTDILLMLKLTGNVVSITTDRTMFSEAVSRQAAHTTCVVCVLLGVGVYMCVWTTTTVLLSNTVCVVCS